MVENWVSDLGIEQVWRGLILVALEWSGGLKAWKVAVCGTIEKGRRRDVDGAAV